MVTLHNMVGKLATEAIQPQPRHGQSTVFVTFTTFNDPHDKQFRVVF